MTLTQFSFDYDINGAPCTVCFDHDENSPFCHNVQNIQVKIGDKNITPMLRQEYLCTLNHKCVNYLQTSKQVTSPEYEYVGRVFGQPIIVKYLNDSSIRIVDVTIADKSITNWFNWNSEEFQQHLNEQCLMHFASYHAL